MRWLGWAARAVGFVGALLLLSACHQNGTVFAVDTTADTVDVDPGDGLCADVNGDCSLRAAINEANDLPGVEEIRLVDGETYTLTIAGEDQEFLGSAGDLDIIGAVVITGDATIDANGIDRVIDLYPVAGLVEIDGPDLTGGSAANGPAIQLQAPSQLTLMRSNVHGNTGSGTGAIAVFGGSHFVWSSTFFDNDTDSHIASFAATVDLQNITMTRDPGGPVAVRPTAGSTTKIRYSTLMGGPGFLDSTGSVTLDRSIVSGCSAPVTSTGFNIGVGPTCGLAQPSDLTSTDPLLGPLADNGGSVLTMLPADASPAVDGGGNPSPYCTLFALDARDVGRVAGPACDIGAVELEVGADCAPLNLVQYADLRRCDLSEMDLSGIPSIAFADLTGASFAGSNLANADLYGTTARGVDFTGATLDLVDFYTADLTGSTFTDATVNATEFSFAVFDGVRSGGLTGTPLPFTDGHEIIGGYLVGPRVDLGGADLDGLDLSGADLTGVRSGGISGVPGGLPFGFLLTGGHLVGPGVDLEGAELAGVDLVGVRSGGIVGTPASLPSGFVLAGGYLVGPAADLAGADLDGLDLSAASLGLVRSGAVTGAPILPPGYALVGGFLVGPGVDLAGADLGTLDLSGVDLSGVRSGGVTGSPGLPAAWALWNGYLIGPGADLTGADLTGADLAGVDLTGVTLDYVRSGGITGTPVALPNSWRLTASSGHLVGPRADLTGAVISDPLGFTLTEAVFVDAVLTGADFFGAYLEGADFTGAVLAGVRSGNIAGTPAALPDPWILANGNLVGPGADLRFADLADTILYDAVLTGADLRGADLTNAGLTGVDLTGAWLTTATLADAHLSLATLVGVRSGGISGVPASLPIGYVLTSGSGYLAGPGVDLSGAALAGAHLEGVDLTGADLSGGDFAGTRFDGATLTDTVLTAANLATAVLPGVRSGGIAGAPAGLPTNWSLIGGYLIGSTADLSGADLSGLDLAGVELQNADLSGATLDGVSSGGITGVPFAMPPQWAVRNGYIVGPAAELTGADLTGADLTGVSLAAATLDGVTTSGADPITGAPAVPADWVLSGGALFGPGADVSAAFVLSTTLHLAGATLDGIQFGGSFPDSDFSGATFTNGSWFTGGDLSGSDFTGADLGDTILSYSDLSDTTLAGADLSGADLEGVRSTPDGGGGSIVGVPTLLPAGWCVMGSVAGPGGTPVNGYLIGPYADLGRSDFTNFTSFASCNGALQLTATRFADSFDNGPSGGLPDTTGSRNIPFGCANQADSVDLQGVDFPDGIEARGVYDEGTGTVTCSAILLGANLQGANLPNSTFFATVLALADISDANLSCEWGAAACYSEQVGMMHANLASADVVSSDFTGMNLVDTARNTANWNSLPNAASTCPDGTLSIIFAPFCQDYAIPPP